MISGRTTNGVTLEKNQKFLKEEMTAKKMEEEEWFKFNPLVGFRCLHYSVSEAIGKLRIHVINKVVGEQFKVGVRTRDGTAMAGDDFRGVDEVLEFGPEEHDKYIEVEILNDDLYEENEDFYVELYDPDNNQKLPGDDTETKITVIDDDQPGILGFEKRQVTVHPKEGVAGLKVHRLSGADGTVSVSFETGVPEGLEKGSAQPGKDFEPVQGIV